MAATPTFFLMTLPSSNDPTPKASLFHIAMISFFNFFLFLTLFIVLFTLYSISKNNNNVNGFKKQELEEEPIKIQPLPVNDTDNTVQEQKQETCTPPDPKDVCSLLLEILPPPNSPEWDTLLGNKGEDFHNDPDEETGAGQEGKKKKKKRAKKKKAAPNEEQQNEKEEVVVDVCPFTINSSSAIQKKIKKQYDQLVKSNAANGLTIDQTMKVGQFVRSLVQAKDELEHRSDVVKRKFIIAKALMHNADRSTFNRQREHIYKLELYQKRLEDDCSVYNWLQEQIKLSPGYKRMLEIGEMDIKVKPGKNVKDPKDDFGDMSFEELLAQEKKDSFWQKNGKMKK